MGTDRRALPVLLLVVLTTFTAQQVLTPVLPPLAREMGLGEVGLGSVITVAAAVFASTSLVWGRVVDRIGRRAVLLLGTGAAALGLVTFALVAQASLAGALDPTATYLLFLLTRGVLFGLGIGAVPVAAMAMIAATTASDADRAGGIGRIGAAQGLSLVLGPALGAALAAAGLLGPVWVAPAVVAVSLLLVVVAVPRDPARPVAQAGGPARAGLRPWDPRLWPVLLGGFGLYLALSMIQIVIGFLLQDRLDLDPAGTVAATGTVFVVCGVVLIAVQGVVVPRLRWRAARLLRVGAPIAAVALALLLVAGQLWSVIGAMALLAIGLGLAVPGYATAPTLLVGPDEQGGVAGLVQAVTGSTFVIGPLAGTALYGLSPALPVLAAAVACTAATLFVWLHPALRVPRLSGASAVRPPAP